MRCPECEQRNSVAAKKCKFCGARFKRKEMSKGVKICLAVLGLVVGASAYLMFALPKIVDPAEQLISVAKRVASGPTSPDDAKKARTAFDEAVKNLLEKYGAENSNSLSSRLKNCLPSNAFEVLVVDLPKALKLVEIDTVLQASDFLIMRGTNEVKVFPLPGFGVYDDARAVNDQAGSVIVLAGHSGGQPPHKPIVQTYALLPDSIMDETISMVPAMAGEGTAKFAKDSTDVFVELSASSMAQSEKIAMNPAPGQDKIIRMKLQWKDAKYIPTAEMPHDTASIMMMLARTLKHPEFTSSMSSLGPQAAKLIKENASAELDSLSVQKQEEKKRSVIYSILTAKKRIGVELKKDGADNWQLASYSVTAAAPAAAAQASKSGVNASPDNSSTAATTTTGTDTAAAQKSGTAPDILAGLTPEKAGHHSTEKASQPVSTIPAATTGINTKPAGTKGSTWLDDEQNKTDESKHSKPPVAVLPPGLKNAQSESANAEKEKKDKLDKEKKEKEKQDRAQKERAAKEKTDKENKAAEQSTTTAKIAENRGTNTVRMRSGPSLNNRTVDSIPAGAKIKILGQTKDWYKISFAGKTGYVFAPLVETTSAATGNKSSESTSNKSTESTSGGARSQKSTTKPSTAQPPPSNTSAVVVRAMTVRDEKRRPITAVQVGEHIVVLSGLNKNGRYKVKLPDGTVGYVHKDALDVKVETPPEFVP